VAQGGESFWIASTPDTDYPALEGDVEVDVAVLGGGIAGVTTAALLKRAGKTVALVEPRRIVRGATGYTTAKVTAGHGVLYSELVGRLGERKARLYAESNQAAVERIVQIVEEGEIACDLERRSNYVYAESDRDRERVRREAAAMSKLGLRASFVTETPLPYPVLGAARLENQAQLHPRKYLLALASTIQGDGCHVFERTTASNVREGDPCRVETDRGTIRAADVVVATHLPFLDRGLFFVRAHPHRSYAICAPVETSAAPDGMFINAGTPTRSVRTARDGERLLLLVGGEGHRTGAADDEPQRYDRLEQFLREHWQAGEVEYRWSTQDYLAVDRVPFVGPLRPGSRHVYVATAFNKWGMTSTTAAAIVLTDAIVGRDNAWSEVYDSNRLRLRASASRFLKGNVSAGLHFVGDRLERPDKGTPGGLEPGYGAMMRIGGRKRAVYRGDDGTLHVLSPVCRHLWCHVEWNAAERTWDCPCHGSRYAGDGRVIEGPSVHDLRRVHYSEQST
jgi:glycine/D-amino acid oxidase-like deaminating enzyme/nitrite reductase/ring-hydroxylating ferredoxin subunit